MKTLVITLEQSKLLRPDILSWLTSTQNNVGVETETYWMLRTEINLINSDEDYEIQKLIALLHMCTMYSYTNLMITKNV